MNDIETVISNGILLSAAEFAPIFRKAWYVVINGALYEKIDDYESDNDDELCTVFSAVECDDVFEISYKYEEVSDVLYNRQTGEYEFLSQDLRDIPAFQILGLVKPDRT
jgi:hypothetical protein